MSNKILVLSLLCALSINLFAQKSKNVTYTKKIVRLSSRYVEGAFSINSSEMVLYTNYNSAVVIKSIPIKKNSKVALYKLDENLNIVQKNSIKSEFYNKRINIEKIMKIGNFGWLFFTYNNYNTKVTYLFAQKFDYHNLETTDDPIKIAETPYSKSQKYFNKYTFEQSENGKLIMITAESATGRTKSSSTALTVWVYNQNMELLNYVNKLKLPNNGSIKSTTIADDGSFNIIGLSKKEKSREKKSFKDFLKGNSNNNELSLSMFNYDSLGEIHDYSFGEEKLKILDIKSSINNNTGNYCIVGLYTENKKGAKGIICSQLSSKDFSEISFVKAPFSDKFINNANKKYDIKSESTKKKTTKKKKDKDENESSNDDESKPKSKYLDKLDKNAQEPEEEEKKDLKTKDKSKDTEKDEDDDKKSTSNKEITNLNKIADVVFDNDDNPICIFEKRWVNVVTTTSSKGGTSTTYYYHYGDAVIAKIENGEILNSKIIRKDGTTTNISYPAGLSVLTNDDYVILSYSEKQIDFKKDDLSSKYENADTRREKSYTMSGTRIKLASNKSLITTPKAFKEVKLELIIAK
ncbi:MAG: hypothetical protein HUU47_01780 [Bacteroidetes bacterium]|nr:hypothetical protein [Bacteroidota bacterium]